MKKLGLLGGMGPESTLLYYQKLNALGRELTPDKHFPPMVVESIDMFPMLEACMDGRTEELTRLLLQGIRCLEAAGAQLIATASNTPHVALDALRERVQTPILGIVEPACQAARERGFARPLWLGTRFSMGHPYFKAVFAWQGMTLLTPDAPDREMVNAIIAGELEYGVVKEESRARLRELIGRMAAREGADAVVLGCTELPLLLSGQALPLPLLDTVENHIAALLKELMA